MLALIIRVVKLLYWRPPSKNHNIITTYPELFYIIKQIYEKVKHKMRPQYIYCHRWNRRLKKERWLNSIQVYVLYMWNHNVYCNDFLIVIFNGNELCFEFKELNNCHTNYLRLQYIIIYIVVAIITIIISISVLSICILHLFFFLKS